MSADNPLRLEPQPFHDAPRYFRRVWDTTGIPAVQDGEAFGRPAVIVTPQLGRVVIYGYTARSTYEEDRPMEDRAWARNRTMPSMNFSKICPEGEYGFIHVDDVVEITQEEFEAAEARGWDES